MQIEITWPPPQKERAHPEDRGAQKKAQSDPNDTPLRKLRQGTKAASLLALFLERGDRGLNCFEAVRLAHDYVLRTSVSNFQLQCGLVFHRRFEQVPGYNDSLVECVRYRIAPESIERARELIGISAGTDRGAR
jgi:hypothetical protein